MNLIMLDIDGTLTESYEYDQEIFGRVIGEVLGIPPVNADLNGFVDKTSLGVTSESFRRMSGKDPDQKVVNEVKRLVQRRLKELYRQDPGNFRQVPGAERFLERLRGLKGTGIAIATGCWLEEALFKLHASGLKVEGIPMASSDDDRNRMRVMQIAVEKALNFYACRAFKRIIYLGDGPWDLEASLSLGYGFIGIGPRLKGVKELEESRWHADYKDIEAVTSCVQALFEV